MAITLMRLLCVQALAAVVVAALSIDNGALARDAVGADVIRTVASRLDATYLDHGMGGLVGDEKRCYAAAGHRVSSLKVCMLYDMSVRSLDIGVKSYFDIRGGVNPDVASPYQSDQAFGGRMKLDTYYAFHGSVDDATAYFGSAVVDVLQAVADKREMLVRFDAR